MKYRIKTMNIYNYNTKATIYNARIKRHKIDGTTTREIKKYIPGKQWRLNETIKYQINRIIKPLKKQ